MQRSIKHTKDQLWRAEEASTKSRKYEEVDRLKRELNILYDKEEKMWHQLWTQGGGGESPPSFYNGLGTIYIASSRERTF